MREEEGEHPEECEGAPAAETVDDFEVVVLGASECWVGGCDDGQEEGHEEVCEDQWRNVNVWHSDDTSSSNLHREEQSPDSRRNSCSAVDATELVDFGKSSPDDQRQPMRYPYRQCVEEIDPVVCPKQ